MRWRFSIILIASIIGGIALCYRNFRKANPKTSGYKVLSYAADETNKMELARLNEHSRTLADFAKQHHYNRHYSFLIDMRLPSGSKRFFIYDFIKDSVLSAGLVTHGSGSDAGDSLRFSNIPESNCTSLGKYRIGSSYNGKFGLAYKLYGLDPTNSKAFERFVVLHSHPCVPSGNVSPQPICQSWGCPTVSPSFLSVLKTYLDKTEAPMLLSIFY